MSNVTLTIRGRTYTVACAEGEEAHILQLGRMIEEKIAAMGETAGLSEQRALLFAALLLADELHETKAKVQAQADLPLSQPPGAAPDSSLLALDAIASKLENLASRLES